MTISSLLVTAAAGSAGQAVSLSIATSSVGLVNVTDGQPFDYQVGAGEWQRASLGMGSGVFVPVDLSATTLKLRNVWGGQATVQIDTREAAASSGSGGGTPGHVSRASDVAAARAFTAADFGVGIVPLNNAAAQAFTLNLAATMGITGAGNVLPVQILGALHTFVAGAGVTINDLTGTRQLNGKYVFVQRGTSEVWDFE